MNPSPSLRVLHVHSGNLYGGVEVFFNTMMRTRAAAPEIEHHFALCFDKKIAGELRTMGLPVHILAPVRVSRPWTVLKARRALKSLLRNIKFDVVICHHAWAQGLFGGVVRGVPEVFWLYDPPCNAKLHWTDRLAARAVPQLTICDSKFTEGYLPRLYGKNAPAVTIYCAVEAPEFAYTPQQLADARTELGVAADQTVLIQIGRWERHKGHLEHLAGLARLKDRTDWRCWIVGGAQRPKEVELKDEVTARAAELGIADRVQILGFVPDARKLLAAADIYCQPNGAPEPFGLTFIEAMYAGKPVVTAAHGGPLETVDPSCGRLVPPGDADALAATLATLLDQPELRRSLGAAGPARAHALCDATYMHRRIYETLLMVRNNFTAGAGAHS
jgi:glycosyltransferase involved in cell wall biosynthesis